MKEIWKNIEGLDGYKVSNLGRVKSMNYRRSGAERLMSQTENLNCLKVNIRNKLYPVHRLVATAFLPYPEEKCSFFDVIHINGNPYDNRVFNLKWCSRSERYGYKPRTDFSEGCPFEVNTYNQYGDIVTSNSFTSFAAALTFYEEIDDKYKEFHERDNEGFTVNCIATTLMKR